MINIYCWRSLTKWCGQKITIFFVRYKKTIGSSHSVLGLDSTRDFLVLLRGEGNSAVICDREKARLKSRLSPFGLLHLVRISALLVPLVVLLVLLSPANSWALQTHGAQEGLYVHQMAHGYFFIALAYLFWHIRCSTFRGKGWRYLLFFCFLMMCWNVLTFFGHAVDARMGASLISTTSGYLQEKILGPFSWYKIVFYVARLDYLVAMPALFFLSVGMRALYRSIEEDVGEDGK